MPTDTNSLSCRSLPPAFAGTLLPVALVVAVWLSLFLIRITAPPDLFDKDQERPAAYMLDAVQNGHWLVQRDDYQALPGYESHSICSKPPVYTWCGAALTLLFGRISAWCLYLPTGAAVLGSCLLIWAYGRRHFGPLAGFLGALFLLFSSSGNRMLCLARTDSLFTLGVTLAMLLGFRAWRNGRGWVWFWVAGAIATLTKGPLGLVFAAGGLLACLWERRTTHAARWNFRWFPGVLLFLAIAGGWFLLAYLDLGPPLIDKMLREGLAGKSVGAGEHLPGQYLYKPASYLLSRFLPWSLLTLVALWRLWRQPAADADARRFERWLTCFLVAGLLLLGLGVHQRADLMYPLLPAAALLAGREAARWLPGRLAWRTLAALGLALWLGMSAGFMWYYHWVQARDPVVVQTVGLRHLAADLEARFGTQPPIVFVDAPYALQFYLNTMRPRRSVADAAQALAGNSHVMVAVKERHDLEAALPAQVRLWEIARYPATGKSLVTIVANYAAAEGQDRKRE